MSATRTLSLLAVDLPPLISKTVQKIHFWKAAPWLLSDKAADSCLLVLSFLGFKDLQKYDFALNIRVKFITWNRVEAGCSGLERKRGRRSAMGFTSTPAGMWSLTSEVPPVSNFDESLCFVLCFFFVCLFSLLPRSPNFPFLALFSQQFINHCGRMSVQRWDDARPWSLPWRELRLKSDIVLTSAPPTSFLLKIQYLQPVLYDL